LKNLGLIHHPLQETITGWHNGSIIINKYILELIETYQQDVFLLVNFNDWCGKEPFLISAIEKYIDLPIKDKTPYKEKEKDSFSVDPTLKEMAIVIYNKLLLISSRQ